MSCHAMPSSGKASAKQQRPAFTHPTTYLSNEFENLKSKISYLCEDRGGRHSHNPTGDHRRDSGPPRHRFRFWIPAVISPIMRSRIKVVGSVLPPAPLPHNPLRFNVYDQMARDFPSAGGESRPPRQTSTLLDWTLRRRS